MTIDKQVVMEARKYVESQIKFLKSHRYEDTAAIFNTILQCLEAQLNEPSP